MAEQLMLLVWDTVVTTNGSGQAIVTAKKPLHRLSVPQAAKMLGCAEWTVRKAFRAGKITGWKPGAIARRRDGRDSNAALVLDAGSVLSYKESVTERGVF